MKAIQYYHCVGRPLTAGLVRWSILQKAYGELTAFEEKEPEGVTKLKKANQVLAFIDEFQMNLSLCKSAREVKSPLTYVICENREVPGVIPALANQSPYSV